MTKKALLIGINYKGTGSELHGCINDVKDMKKYLMEHAGYAEDNIRVMTEEEKDKKNIPKAANIIQALYKISTDTNKENTESIFIHYSGHGTHVKDNNGDETDGQDEAICPVDYSRSGILTDDVIKHSLSFVNPKTTMTCVFDCCHSGTILDLEFKYINGINEPQDTKGKSKDIKANSIMISGCTDKEVSADAWNINNSRKAQGALTANLLTILKENNYHITCYDLLNKLHTILKKQNFSQHPQITCTQKLTENDMFCSTNKPFMFCNK